MLIYSTNTRKCPILRWIFFHPTFIPPYRECSQTIITINLSNCFDIKIWPPKWVTRLRLGKLLVWVMAITILFSTNHHFIYLPQSLPQLTDIHAQALFQKLNSFFLLKCQILLTFSKYTNLLYPDPTERQNPECMCK